MGVAATAWFVCYFALKQPKNWHIVGKSEEKNPKKKSENNSETFVKTKFQKKKKELKKRISPQKFWKLKTFRIKSMGQKGPKTAWRAQLGS